MDGISICLCAVQILRKLPAPSKGLSKPAGDLKTYMHEVEALQEIWVWGNQWQMKYDMVKVSDNMKNSCSRVLDRFWHVIIRVLQSSTTDEKGNTIIWDFNLLTGSLLGY